MSDCFFLCQVRSRFEDTAPVEIAKLLVDAGSFAVDVCNVILLMLSGATVHTVNQLGWTAFMHAAFNGNVMVFFLIVLVPTLIAAGNLELMKLLFEHNAHLLARNKQGRNALMYASVRYVMYVSLHCFFFVRIVHFTLGTWK